jgi:hypothetical protein
VETKVNNGIQLNNKNKIQTILHADNQIIITKSEDELQIAVNELNKIGKKYDMKISISKKSMGLCGKDTQRVKIVIDDKIIEQISSFIYLGNLISNKEKDINTKLQKYNKLNGVIKRHFGKQMSTETKLRLHICSKPALFYGSEACVINKREAQKLEAAQMRFLRPLLGFTRLDHQRNSDIRQKLEVDNTVEDIQLYQKKWNWHLQRINRNRIPQLAFRYQPDGKRDLGRPRQRWRDQEHLQELQRNRFLKT